MKKRKKFRIKLLKRFESLVDKYHDCLMFTCILFIFIGFFLIFLQFIINIKIGKSILNK